MKRQLIEKLRDVYPRNIACKILRAIRKDDYDNVIYYFRELTLMNRDNKLAAKIAEHYTNYLVGFYKKNE